MIAICFSCSLTYLPVTRVCFSLVDQVMSAPMFSSSISCSRFMRISSLNSLYETNSTFLTLSGLFIVKLSLKQTCHWSFQWSWSHQQHHLMLDHLRGFDLYL